MATKAMIDLNGKVFTLHAADIEHIEEAAALLKKRFHYTAAERLIHVAAFIREYVATEPA